MILDIAPIVEGQDLQFVQSEAPRAANVLSTQLGSLEYAPDFGTDRKYFLESEFRIQPESFQSYCVQRLLQHQINVVNVIDVVSQFMTSTTFAIGSSETDGSLVG